jgi:hypothetical protein
MLARYNERHLSYVKIEDLWQAYNAPYARSSSEFGLPPHRFLRAAEKLRHPLIMRQVIDDRPDCELALHVKRRLEFTRRE